MKKLPQKIKEMLDSEDVEMAQLGANLMKEYIPKEKWAHVLEMFKYGKEEAELDIYKIKWDWRIEDDNIIIERDRMTGVYGPLYTWKFAIQSIQMTHIKIDNIVPERVRDMLASQDLEMVQLGVTLLQEHVKSRAILEEIVRTSLDKKFSWEIYGGKVEIWEPGNRYNGFKIYTGKGGMEMFNKAFKNAFKNQQK